MPRAVNGTYTLPAGNPVVTGTTIESAWANNTMTDIQTAMTDSLSRSGEGAMLAPLKLVDGAVGAPGLTFATETTTGWYRAGAGDIRFSIGGVAQLRFQTSETTIYSGILTLVASAAVAPNYIQFGDATSPYVAFLGWASAANEIMTGSVRGDIGWTVDAKRLLFSTNNGASINVQITAVGGVIISAPASGVTLSVAAVAGQYGFAIAGGSNSFAAMYFQDGQASTRVWSIGTGQSADGTFAIADQTGSRYILTISTAGNCTIGAPTSGTTLALNAVSAGIALSVSDSTVTGTITFAGTTFRIGATSAHATEIASNGTVVFSASSAGVGSVNDAGTMRAVGFRELPSVVESTSARTLLQGDNGKSVYCNNAGTTTISVPTLAANTVVTLINDTGVAMPVNASGGPTIYWFTGATRTSGNRTLAYGGVMTLWYLGTTTVFVWGTGIT